MNNYLWYCSNSRIKPFPSHVLTFLSKFLQRGFSNKTRAQGKKKAKLRKSWGRSLTHSKTSLPTSFATTSQVPSFCTSFYSVRLSIILGEMKVSIFPVFGSSMKSHNCNSLDLPPNIQGPRLFPDCFGSTRDMYTVVLGPSACKSGPLYKCPGSLSIYIGSFLCQYPGSLSMYIGSFLC